MGEESAVSLLSWPCALSCACGTAAAYMIIATSYRMGAESDQKGERPYLQAFWSLMSALLLLSSTVATIKFLD